MRELCCTVPRELAGQTVGTVLRRTLRLSGGLFRSLKWRENAIRRNGVPVHVNAAVETGDVLTVVLAERRPPSEAVSPCGLPLDVVWEDGDLLVLNKPAGLPMHSSAGPTLAGALRAYLGRDVSAHFVNRLDSGTSGLLIAAKTGWMHDRFRAMLHSAGLYREYRAVALGRVTPPAGVVELPIAPDPEDFRRRRISPEGRYARTVYETLAQNADFTLLRLAPDTGRTHQLRLHMSALGHPLAGDVFYGAPEDTTIARPALHSCLLRFTHPLTGETLRFTAPLPEDMAALLEAVGLPSDSGQEKA